MAEALRDTAAAARRHIGRDLVQIRERIAELNRERNGSICSGERTERQFAGELTGLRYAEQLLATTLERLKPEENAGG